MSAPSSQLNVFLTIDTEIWCNGWDNIDAKFPNAFQSYIYGKTKNGNYGLPFQLKMLQEHGLKAVFFVEPLFATRFGIQPLEEIIGLIKEYGQSVELHLHTEWADESKQPIFPYIKDKRDDIKLYNYEEQCALIALGSELLIKAGCKNFTSFRAGSFGANNDTLRAVVQNNIPIDSSYNYFMEPYGITEFNNIHQPIEHNGLIEVPMSTFIDGVRRRRHVQLTACSYAELICSLEQALTHGWKNFVLLSHSFELLNSTFTDRDKVVVKRFEKLCSFLANNSHRIKTAFLNELEVSPGGDQVKPLQLGLIPTLLRFQEQLFRRLN